MSLFGRLKGFLHPAKKLTTEILNNVVLKKLSEVELQVNANFKKWYRQSIINIVVVVILILAGVLAYMVSDKSGLLKLLVAIAYLFSMGVFVFRRIQNVRFIVANKTNIQVYGRLTVTGLVRYPYGHKIKTIIHDIYDKLYNELVAGKKAVLHKIAAKVKLVPSQQEVFEIIYGNIVLFFWNVIYRNLVKFIVFILLFTGLSLFVKNTVLLEMRFSNIFETLAYPFIYFGRLIKRL